MYSSQPVHWKPLVLAAEKAHKERREAEREMLLRHAICAAERALGNDHANVAVSYLLLGDFFSEQDRFQEAELSYRQAVRIYQNLGPDHEILLALATRHLAAAIRVLGRGQEADDLMTLSRQLLFEYVGAGPDEECPVLCPEESEFSDEGVTVLCLDVGDVQPLNLRIESARLGSCSAFINQDIDRRFAADQIVAILQAAEAGVSVEDLAGKYRLPDALIWEWKARYGGLCIRDIRRLRQLEQEDLRRTAS